MSTAPISILKAGLVTSVGLTAPSTCAALRAKLSNPSETNFIDSSGEKIMVHQVELEQPWRGLTKLAKMAAMAITEALDNLPQVDWAALPMLLCVAEADRPGRTAGLDDQLFLKIQNELNVKFSKHSVIIPHGRVGTAIALAKARELIYKAKVSRVLIVAVDSLLSWPTLRQYEQSDRLLTPHNSDGFMPGEAAGALLVSMPNEHNGDMVCHGIGFGQEMARLDSGEPMRADGLTHAMKNALEDAGNQLHDVDYRITGVSGEQYFFKEAALSLNRILRIRKEDFDLWHPAESIGETGAASGVACIALAQSAAEKGYAPGPITMFHFTNDHGACAAMVLRAG